MNSDLFRTVATLSAAWRKSPVVDKYVRPIAAARRRTDRSIATQFVEELYAGAGSIAQQPLLLARLSRPLLDSRMFHLPDPGREWLEAGERVAESTILTAAWLRSRLPGYPNLPVPQLAKGSALTSDEWSLRIPWRHQDLMSDLQLRAEPPGVGDLLLDRSNVLPEPARTVCASLQRSSQFQRLAEARSALADDDEAELRRAVAKSGERLSPAAIDSHEPRLVFPRLQYRETELDIGVAELQPVARSYANAFSACDRLINDVMAVHSQLVTQAGLLPIDDVTDLILTPHDRDKMVSFVSTGESAFFHTHLGTIVRLNHVLVEDAVYVEGISLRFDGTGETVTIRGRVISGTAELCE